MEIISTTGLQQLEEIEAEIVEQSLVLSGAEDRIALLLYKIQESGLWIHKPDDSGETFGRFEDYLRHLADQIRVSRTTLFKYKNLPRFAIENELVKDEDEFIEKGGVHVFNRIRGSTHYDKATGLITGLKDDPENKNPVATVRAIVDGIDVTLPPKEQVAYIRDVINPYHTDVQFGLEPREDGYNVVSTVVNPSGITKQIIGYVNARDQVCFDEFKKRLRITND